MNSKDREKLLAEAFEKNDRDSFSKLLGREIKSLTRFVKHELSYHIEVGEIRENQLQPAELVDEAVLSVFKNYQEKPKNLPLDYWLYGRALDIIRNKISDIKEEASQSISYDRNIPEVSDQEHPRTLGDEQLDYWQIDEDMKMEDIIPDERIEPFDEAISKDEISKKVHKWLAQLPESWRAAFLLNKVEGFEARRVAQVQGLSLKEVRRNIEMARLFLKEKLEETRLI